MPTTKISISVMRLILVIQFYYTNLKKSNHTNMEIKFVIIALIITICQGEFVHQHKRQLYFNDGEHVCMGGFPARKDLIALSVEYIGQGSEGYFADAGTTCSETVKKGTRQIIPAHDWDYYSSSGTNKNVIQFRFSQTVVTKSAKFLNKAISMVATSVIINPTIVNDQLWECEIQEEGYVKPFGIYGRGRPNVMFIKCKKMPKNLQIKSE